MCCCNAVLRRQTRLCNRAGLLIKGARVRVFYGLSHSFPTINRLFFDFIWMKTVRHNRRAIGSIHRILIVTPSLAYKNTGKYSHFLLKGTQLLDTVIRLLTLFTAAVVNFKSFIIIVFKFYFIWSNKTLWLVVRDRVIYFYLHDWN